MFDRSFPLVSIVFKDATSYFHLCLFQYVTAPSGRGTEHVRIGHGYRFFSVGGMRPALGFEFGELAFPFVVGGVDTGQRVFRAIDRGGGIAKSGRQVTQIFNGGDPKRFSE